MSNTRELILSLAVLVIGVAALASAVMYRPLAGLTKTTQASSRSYVLRQRSLAREELKPGETVHYNYQSAGNTPDVIQP